MITYDHGEIKQADKSVFPGVGAAASVWQSCVVVAWMRFSQNIAAGTAVFGICVGMQLLFDRSEEDGGVDCRSFARSGAAF